MNMPREYLMKGPSRGPKAGASAGIEGIAVVISVPEAGRRLGLSRNGSYDAAKRGELPVLRIGRKLLVPLAAFERLLNQARTKSETGSE